MLVYPHEILQNHPLGNKGVNVQNNSCRESRRLLRVAASSNKENERPRNILSVLRNLGTTEKSKTTLKNIGVFYDYPKPVLLLEYLIKIGCEDVDGIVLDFFSGSGTTGHAVMNLNVSEGAKRRFICIQLQEKTDEKSDAKIRGFDNLADICKKRLSVASEELEARNLDLLKMGKQNTGFRVFKLDTSNIRAWNPDRDDLVQTLVDHLEHILPGRSEADILYELLLKLGLDLCVPIEKRSIALTPSPSPASGRGEIILHAIGGGVLMACLAEKITRDDVEPLAQGIVEWHKALAPAGDTTCVFRDSAFADDVAKTNLAAILEQHGIRNARSL